MNHNYVLTFTLDGKEYNYVYDTIDDARKDRKMLLLKYDIHNLTLTVI